MSLPPAGDRTRFLWRNLSRGLIWLMVIIVLFIASRHFAGEQYDSLMMRLRNYPGLIYLIYTLSELFFGILPPELFMIWALELNGTMVYVQHVILQAFISLGAGYIAFLFGKYLHTTILFRYFRRRFIGKYSGYLKYYGLYLIIVAALTPLPWSGISMLVGSVNYPRIGFLKYSLFRLLRFAVYGFIVFESARF